MTTIEETLIREYGPLMSVVQLAKILDRSTEGLRICLRSETKWSQAINATKLKVGRRVYFRTAEIAKYLAEA